MNDRTPVVLDAATGDEGEAREITVADAGVIARLNKSDLEHMTSQAMLPARRRSVKTFRSEALTLATLDEEVAGECSYALERKDKHGNKKLIIGPSSRFAELVAYAWGNQRSGARVVDQANGMIVAQGFFMDLEKNTAMAYEVQRSITDSRGKTFKPDMISVTANAACSIALRNAVLKAVPKALWSSIWHDARLVAIGDVKTLGERRQKAVVKFAQYGVSEEMMLARLERPSLADVTVDDIELLLGILTSIKEGEVTPEEAFAPRDADGDPVGAALMPGKKPAKAAPAAATTQPAGQATPAEPAKTEAGETRLHQGEAQRVETPPGGPRPVIEGKTSTTAELASTAQRQNLESRIKISELTLATVMERAGITDWEHLTVDGFTAVREAITELEREQK